MGRWWKMEMARYSICYCRILIVDLYKAIPFFNLVGNKFALSKSVKEFFLIISSRIATYFSPIAAYLFKYFVKSNPLSCFPSSLS